MRMRRPFADREPKFAGAAHIAQKVLNLLIRHRCARWFSSTAVVQTGFDARKGTQILNERAFDGTISSFAIYLREASVVELVTLIDAQARSVMPAAVRGSKTLSWINKTPKKCKDYTSPLIWQDAGKTCHS